MGWDPAPRIETQVPWISYENKGYAQTPTPDEIENGAKRLSKWISENREYTNTDHILTFAWNEFEEGAWICPTYNDDLNIDADRIKTFAEITKYWKSL